MVPLDPVIYDIPEGPSLISLGISIADFLKKRLATDALDGPLTDYESGLSDDEGDGPLKAGQTGRTRRRVSQATNLKASGDGQEPMKAEHSPSQAAMAPTMDPLTPNPLTTNPLTTNPLTPNLLTTNPLTPNLLTTNPLTTNPLTTNPLTANPLTTNPLTANPLTTNPLTPDPLTANPLTPNPLANQLQSGSNKKKGQRKLKKKLRYRRRRRAERERQRQGVKGRYKGIVLKRRRAAVKNAIRVDFQLLSDALVSKNGWVGKVIKDLPCSSEALSNLVEKHGLTYYPWDGRKTHLLVDEDKRVIGVLLGRPSDKESWDKAHKDAFKALDRSLPLFENKGPASHRRGTFPSIAHGISFGGGQESPRHLQHSAKSRAALDRLMYNSSIQRFCNFASCGFEVYGERNYDYMKSTVEALRANTDGAPDRQHRLRRAYDEDLGVYPCRSLNLGEQTVSIPHTDTLNLAQSWCSITPIGSFDPKLGGQLALWGFGLVVDFPPGSTVLIPSALVFHSNTPIQPGEKRYSLVQYAAGGLFRWVENGFMSDINWYSKATQEQVEQREKDDESRWKRALSMFTTLDELMD